MERPKGFRWTERREEAAMQVARDELTDEEIARRAGICRYTLQKWKRRPEFQERVEGLVATMREAVKGRGIADLWTRIAELDKRWNALRQIIDERAKLYAAVPGGATGLLIPRRGSRTRRSRVAQARGHKRQVAGMSRSDVKLTHDDLIVDRFILRELLHIEKQAAQELGQWGYRRKSPTGVPRVVLVGIPASDAERGRASGY